MCKLRSSTALTPPTYALFHVIEDYLCHWETSGAVRVKDEWTMTLTAADAAGPGSTIPTPARVSLPASN
jgi:hypothetical protein